MAIFAVNCTTIAYRLLLGTAIALLSSKDFTPVTIDSRNPTALGGQGVWATSRTVRRPGKPMFSPGGHLFGNPAFAVY